MKDDTQSINEVVISGKRIERNDMGISSREQSSATQKVNMEDLVAIAPVTSIEDALQGQLGGVDIVLGGGDPGARASIQIRGGSTLNANSEPLIVVDGVPYPAEIDDNTDFSTINNDDLGALLNISPQDIESIEVLKMRRLPLFGVPKVLMVCWSSKQNRECREKRVSASLPSSPLSLNRKVFRCWMVINIQP
mgnify:CR=1 FL=1